MENLPRTADLKITYQGHPNSAKPKSSRLNLSHIQDQVESLLVRLSIRAMEKFSLPHTELPGNLYRVQYPGTQTKFSGNGLEAKDTYTTYTENNLHAFGQSIINQLTWHHRGAQPYILCFSEKEHAENWACKKPWNNGPWNDGSWEVLTIDTKLMPETYVFSLKDLVTRLNLELPKKVTQHIEGAYLCLHKIPSTAIVKVASAREVRSGTYIALIF